MLVENLAAAGFVVVDNRQTSDGVITGFLSLGVHHGSTHASATLALDTPGGRRLWDAAFKERFFSLTLNSDAVTVRADDVAKRLRKDKGAAADAGPLKPCGAPRVRVAPSAPCSRFSRGRDSRGW